MSSVTELLISLGSQDASVRVPAEQAVTSAKEQDLASFLLTLLAEFRDESKPPFSRNMAGTLLKNSVALPLRNVAAREELESRWKQLPAEVRQRVKNEVLETLGSTSKDVRNVAANIIGNLSRIELPAGEWSDLINIIVAACNSNSDQHHDAALTTLGYICEEAGEYEEVEAALEPYSTAILTAIVAGMASTNEDIRYHATNALCNAMDFIHGNMEKEEQRSYLVNALCTTAETCTVERTREKAMECLVNVADLYYSTLPDYISQLHTITSNAIRNDSEAVGLQAMQFWISICEHERELKEEERESECLQYSAMGAKHLSEIALWALVRQEEGQTEDDWNISIAGGKLLQSLTEAVGGGVLEHVLPFVYTNINSADWHQKEAALMAFGCVLSGPSIDQIGDTVAQGAKGLLESVRSDNEQVADTAGWVLSVVCELFPDVFLDVPENLLLFMNTIGNMIGGSNGALMAIRAVHAIRNLALAFEDEADGDGQGRGGTTATNELSQYYSELIRQLLLSVDQNVSPGLRQLAQEALNALVDAAAVDCYRWLTNLLPELHNRAMYRIEAIRNKAGDETENLMMVGLICGAIGSIAKKLKANMLQYMDPVMTLLRDIFTLPLSEETVVDEAIILIGSLSHAVKGVIPHHMELIMPPVLKALSSTNEPSLCQIACGTVGDLALEESAALTPYIGAIAEVLNNNLRDTTVDREMKCAFFGCLGDIALNAPPHAFHPYATGFIQLAEIFVQGSFQLDVTGDIDAEDYRFNLWESLGTFYTGIIQSAKAAKTVDALAPHMESILSFALQASRAAFESKCVEVVFAMIGVIGDLAQAIGSGSPDLKQRGRAALLSPAVEELLRAARQNKECASQADWAMKNLQVLNKA